MSCSLCTTTRCVKSPTASRHHTLYADVLVALRRGLTLTAERYVENARVSNDATGGHIRSLIGASGSTRFAIVYASTETRRRSTGRTALMNTVTRRRCCGGHCLLCSVVTAMSLAPLATAPTVCSVLQSQGRGCHGGHGPITKSDHDSVSAVVNGCVPVVQTDRDPPNHHEVAQQVLLARSCTDIPGSRSH